jgi:hypothetical protein
MGTVPSYIARVNFFRASRDATCYFMVAFSCARPVPVEEWGDRNTPAPSCVAATIDAWIDPKSLRWKRNNSRPGR